MPYDPRKLMPKNGWAIVLADQRETQLASGLHLPVHETGAEKVTELPGRLIVLGGGLYNDALRQQGLKEGVRVLYRGFLRWANPIDAGETWPDGSEKQYFMIDCHDLLGILSEEAKVGIFSGRPAVPHVQGATG
jgi:hypothetical protein